MEEKSLDILRLIFGDNGSLLANKFGSGKHTDNPFLNMYLNFYAANKDSKPFYKADRVFIDKALVSTPLWIKELQEPDATFISDAYVRFCSRIDRLKLVPDNAQDRFKFNKLLVELVMKPSPQSLNNLKYFVMNYLKDGKHFRGNIKNEYATVMSYLNSITGEFLRYQNSYKEFIASKVKTLDTKSDKKVQNKLVDKAVSLSKDTGINCERILAGLMFVYYLYIISQSELSYFDICKSDISDAITLMPYFHPVILAMKDILDTMADVESLSIINSSKVTILPNKPLKVEAVDIPKEPLKPVDNSTKSLKDFVYELDFSKLEAAQDINSFKSALSYFMRSNFMLGDFAKNLANHGLLKPFTLRDSSYFLDFVRDGDPLYVDGQAFKGAKVLRCNIKKIPYFDKNYKEEYPMLCQGLIEGLIFGLNNKKLGSLDYLVGCYMLGSMFKYNSNTVFLKNPKTESLSNSSAFNKAKGSMIMAVRYYSYYMLLENILVQ